MCNNTPKLFVLQEDIFKNFQQPFVKIWNSIDVKMKSINLIKFTGKVHFHQAHMQSRL